MKTLFCLLLVIGSAFAQPVIGPFVVTNADSGYRVHDIQLAVHNDTCEVFMSIVPNGLAQIWDNDATIERIPFYLGTGLPSTDVDELAPANTWNRNIEDVYADASGNWSIAVYSVDEFNEETGYFLVSDYIQTSLFTGSGEQINELTLHTDTLGRYECAMGHLREQTISKSLNGYTLTSLFSGCKLFGTFGEPWAYAVVHQFDSDFSLDTTFDYCDESCAVEFGPQWTTGISDVDGSLVLLSRSFGECGVVTLNGSEQPTMYPLLCLPETESRPLLVRTNSDLYLTVFENRIYEIDATGGCAFLTEIPALTENISTAFLPNYGFAALQVIPGYLLLARIDTSGNEVQPVGVLYETDGTSFIVDADVTISDSGEVIAVWSEYTDWNEGPRVLKIAWTDWTTYLDTPEQQAPTVPREISLSSYPNPFNSTATIKYDLPQAGRAKLTAYDLQGRVVATLFDDFAPAGSAELHWSPENLASGVYFISLEAPLAHATHKILYLK